MSQILITGGSSGGASDDCTALKSDIPKGLKAVTKDSDDKVVEGTLELTGNANSDDVLEGKTFYNTNVHSKQTGTLKLTGSAQTTHVFNGQTFYSTDPKKKLTGTMTVNSIMSFKLAGVSGRQILFQWQNPTLATGKPFTGIFINYSTSGYPGTGGTRLYTGFGNNSNPGGLSQLWANLPALGTTYYFSAYAYAQTSAGDIYSQEFRAVGTTGGVMTNTYTYSQNVTVPAGFTQVDIFCVGGGGGGGRGYGSTSNMYAEGGGGGGGGYTNTAYNVSVNQGEVLNCIIGAGGTGAQSGYNYNGKDGSITSVSRNGVTLCTANGGRGGQSDNSHVTIGAKGGSDGGEGAYNDYDGYKDPGGNGGSDGNPGQGRTTRAFGESWNTIYCGGGGGGDCDSGLQGAGGAGGGGAGGSGRNPGNNGVPNTGGGGGGGGGNPRYRYSGGNGASGVVLIRFK